MHDGEHKEGVLKFEDDGTIESHYGDGKGTWKVIDHTRILAHFGVLDHYLEFNLQTFEAILTDPDRTPPSRMKPSTSYGNDIQTTRDTAKHECESQSRNYGEIKTPEECAAVAFNDGCSYFMFSHTYTVWGCRCCSVHTTGNGI